MKRTLWVALDLVLSAVIAVLGNIVASYVQERLDLADSARFAFVAILFAFCLGVSLLVTLRRSAVEQGREEDETESTSLQVRQEIDRVQERAEVVGVEAESLPPATSAGVHQEAGTVAGSMTGIRIGMIGRKEPEDSGE